MDGLLVPGPLKQRLGHDAAEGLVEMFVCYDQLAGARADHKLDLLRMDMREGFSSIRQEMATLRADMCKWMLAFWIGQFAALVGALSFMLPR